MDRREWHRTEIDLPTIGAIYTDSDDVGVYGGGVVVIFMNGHGCPFRDEAKEWGGETTLVKNGLDITGSPDSEPVPYCRSIRRS